MKKIGIIDKVELSGPGTKNIIYKNPDVDGYVYVSYLSVTVCDVAGIMMKKVEPKYNGNEIRILGDIIEYDEETNTINSLDPFRKLTESEMNQINYIYQQYMKISNGQSNFDLIIQSLSGCTNTNKMKKMLQQFSLKKDSFDERINAEIILENIRSQIIMRNQQMNNTNGLKR